jgi:hypothetical protein
MASEIDEFGEKIIHLVRDSAISSLDVLKNDFSKDPARIKLNAYDNRVVNAVLDIVISEIVDETVFKLLAAIDGGDLKMFFRSSDGAMHDLEEVGMGELGGWLSGEDGWIENFSQYRPTQKS